MKKIEIGPRDKKITLAVKALQNPAARKISQNLPIESKAKLWGDEIYFDTGIDAPAEGGTMEVEAGDIAYWPEGKCLCVFFGKTPASENDKPVPASKVVIVGKAEVDPAKLRGVKSGAKIKVS